MSTSSTLQSTARPAPHRAGAIAWAGLAVVLMALNLRTAVTGITPLLEEIGADLGFGVATAGLIGTIPAASFAVFGFLAPTVTRRIGLERTAIAAMILTALSLLLRAASPTTATVVLATILALAGIGAANVVIVPLVKVWFPNHIALWTSLYLLLLQVGQFVAPLIAVPVADASSWRFSIGMWAIPAAIAAVVWIAVSGMRTNRATAPTGSAPRITASPTTWGLVVLFGMMSVSNYSIITWVPAVLTDAGASPALSGTMVALYSVWGVLAAFAVPPIATRMTNPFIVVVVCAVLLIVGYLGLVFAPLSGTIVWMCALGLGVSTFPLSMTLINRRTTSPQATSAASGFVQGIGYAIACVAPLGLGLLHEATGSWTAPLIVLAVTTIPGAIGGWYACRPRMIDEG